MAGRQPHQPGSDLLLRPARAWRSPLAGGAGRIGAWFERLQLRPHAVLVHENDLAQTLARAVDEPPRLILTGHGHDHHIDRYCSVLILDTGTVVAGGIFGIGEEEV